MSSVSSRSKIIVGVDYGTTCTGVSFIEHSTTQPSFRTRIHNTEERLEHLAPGKVPSRIAYNESDEGAPRRIRAWGFDVEPGMTSCSWTKLLLDAEANLTEFDDDALNHAAALGIFHLPAGKAPEDVVADYLCRIYQYTWEMLHQSTGKDLNDLPVEFWFTVPATWSEHARIKTKEAAARAGFGRKPSHSIFMMTEPEAAAEAVFDQYPADFKSGDGVLVCDCGGGTVDIATFLVADVSPALHIRKITAVQGGKCGSAAIDSRFYQLMSTRFGSAFDNLPRGLIAPGSDFMDEFEFFKHRFSRVRRDPVHLRLKMKANHLDPRYYNLHHVVLSSGDLQSLFDPVVSRIIHLIDTQLKAADKECGYSVINKIVVVGGFAASPYLQEALQCYHQPGKRLVTIPRDPQLAIATGIALHGLHGHATVTQRCPQHYGFETSQPRRTDVEPGLTSSWDIFDEANFVHKVASWVVRKDERYPHEYRHVQSLSWIHRSGDPLARPISIFGCGLPVAPKSTDHNSVALVGNVVAAFNQLNLEEFNHRMIDGQMVYRLECQVETTFNAEHSTLDFVVQALGKTIGKSSLQMRDMDLRNRPWTSPK